MIAGAGDGAEDVDESWDDLGQAPVSAELKEPLCGECNTADDDVVQDDVGDAFRNPRELPEPKAPSRAAARQHALTHWPYASWCPYCVMARRNSDPHFQNREGDNRALPLLVLDYCFVRNQPDQDLVTVLVGKLYPTRKTFGCVVDVKGMDEYAICRMTEFIKSAGVHKFVYECDQ